MTYMIDISYWEDGWKSTETVETGEWDWDKHDHPSDAVEYLEKYITDFTKEWFENGGAGKGRIRIYTDDPMFEEPLTEAETDFIEVIKEN